jgi:GxxExxY protein
MVGLQSRWKTMRELTDEIIGAAVEVHRYLGPGLLESTYEACLRHELYLRQVPFQHQVNLPLDYKGLRLENKHRIDLVIADRVVVEIKAVETILPVHDAQLLSYLRLGGWSVGLLINFHVPILTQGIHRKVWRHDE